MSQHTHAAAVEMERRLPDWKLAYRVPEAAAALGVSEPTIWRRISSGKLKARKDGSVTLISRQAMLDYLDAMEEIVPMKQAS